MKTIWKNVKDYLPDHQQNVLGYYELWGDYRPSGEEKSKHYVLCFYDVFEEKWYKTDNPNTIAQPSHWTELPTEMPESDFDQRINIGWR